MITYRLLWDTDNDRTPETDITALVRDIRWVEGFDADFAPVVGETVIKLSVDNDGRWGSGNYIRSRRVRLEAKAPSHVAWQLQFEALADDFSFVDENTICVVTLQKMWRVLESQQIQSTLEFATQENMRTDEIINALLRGAVTPVSLAGYFTLDVSRLDDDAVFPPNEGRDIGLGKLVVKKVGDTWAAGTSILEAIRQTTRSEMGRFWFGRDGEYKWRGRGYLQHDNLTSVLAIDEGWRAAVLANPGVRYRKIKLVFSPRYVGDSLEDIALYPDIIFLDVGKQKKITMAYRSPEGLPIGARDVVEPVAGTDYVASTQIDSTGAAAGATVGVSVEFAHLGTSCRITFYNPTFYVCYITSLRVRGKIVQNNRPHEYEIVNYDVKIDEPELVVQADILDNEEEAQRYLEYLNAFYDEEREQVVYVEFTPDSSTLATQIVERYLLDRITVTFPGFSARDYFIRRIERRIGGEDVTRWYLEWADSSVYLTLDDNVKKLDVGKVAF